MLGMLLLPAARPALHMCSGPLPLTTGGLGPAVAVPVGSKQGGYKCVSVVGWQVSGLVGRCRGGCTPSENIAVPLLHELCCVGWPRPEPLCKHNSTATLLSLHPYFTEVLAQVKSIVAQAMYTPPGPPAGFRVRGL
jgi:hypothetical protein